MKRYYLSPVYYDTSIPGEENWKHRAMDIRPYLSFVPNGATITTYPEGHPQAGQPIAKVLLILVAAVDHKRLRDTALIPLPHQLLSTKLGAIETAERLTTRERIIVEAGIGRVETELAWDNNDSIRSLLNYYGRMNFPDTFDADNFDLDES